jgi:hypothetical protein
MSDLRDFTSRTLSERDPDQRFIRGGRRDRFSRSIFKTAVLQPQFRVILRGVQKSWLSIVQQHDCVFTSAMIAARIELIGRQSEIGRARADDGVSLYNFILSLSLIIAIAIITR